MFHSNFLMYGFIWDYIFRLFLLLFSWSPFLLLIVLLLLLYLSLLSSKTILFSIVLPHIVLLRQMVSININIEHKLLDTHPTLLMHVLNDVIVTLEISPILECNYFRRFCNYSRVCLSQSIKSGGYLIDGPRPPRKWTSQGIVDQSILGGGTNRPAIPVQDHQRRHSRLDSVPSR